MDQPRYDTRRMDYMAVGFLRDTEKRSNGSKEKQKEIHEQVEVTWSYDSVELFVFLLLVKGEVSQKFAVISKPKNVWQLAETTK